MFIPEGVDDDVTWHQLTPSDSTAHAAPATRGVVGVDFFDVASSRHSASRARRRRAPRAR